MVRGALSRASRTMALVVDKMTRHPPRDANYKLELPGSFQYFRDVKWISEYVVYPVLYLIFGKTLFIRHVTHTIQAFNFSAIARDAT